MHCRLPNFCIICVSNTLATLVYCHVAAVGGSGKHLTSDCLGMNDIMLWGCAAAAYEEHAACLAWISQKVSLSHLATLL